MRKYIAIILSVLVGLELLTIIIYREYIASYVSDSISGIGEILLVLAIYVVAFIMLFRAARS